MEMWLSHQQVGDYAKCLRDAGFPDRAPDVHSELPDRDDPFLASHWQFPDVEALASDGFPYIQGSPAELDEEPPGPAFYEANQRCRALINSSLEDLALRFAGARAEWEKILEVIENDPAVAEAKSAFTACLHDAGLQPAPDHDDYSRYLNGLIQSTEDEQELATILRDEGILYAECGRDLFELREQLRSGEGRDAFLNENQDLIDDLSELLARAGAD